jgi:pimeloyl-ACP methyl ester carboxylesterase
VILLLHGFADSQRTWDLVRPRLPGPTHAPALPGHLGGPPYDGDLHRWAERVYDEAGPAHVVGSSLGGHLALRLADRALSVTAIAPAVAPLPDALFTGGPAPLRDVVADPAALPREAVEHLTRAARAVDPALAAAGRAFDHTIDPSRIACPVRLLWGTEDRLLPWPPPWSLPQAEWVPIEGAGHLPQLERPVEVASLVLR